METTTISRVDETPIAVTARVARIRLVAPSAAAARPETVSAHPSYAQAHTMQGPALSGVGMCRVPGDIQVMTWLAGPDTDACGTDATDKFSTRLGPPSCSPV